MRITKLVWHVCPSDFNVLNVLILPHCEDPDPDLKGG